MTYDNAAAAETHNTALRTALDAALETRGYLVTRATSQITHAAVSLRSGHSGYNWPRSLCQANTTTVYHHTNGDQTVPVTCKRCQAGMEKRGIAA